MDLILTNNFLNTRILKAHVYRTLVPQVNLPKVVLLSLGKVCNKIAIIITTNGKR